MSRRKTKAVAIAPAIEPAIVSEPEPEPETEPEPASHSDDDNIGTDICSADIGSVDIGDMITITNNTRKIAQGRKPGRPPKNKTVKPVKKGICYRSSGDTVKMEFVHNNPENFKKIFKLFKSYGIDEIIMEFHPTVMFIKIPHTNMTDPNMKNALLLDINVKWAHHYYSGEIFHAVVKCRDIYSIMETIGKFYTNMTLLVEKIYFINNKFRIMFWDEEAENDVIHDIKVDRYESGPYGGDNNNFLEMFDTRQHPLQVTFNSSYFKRILGNIKSFTDDFVLQKHKNGPIVFPFKKHGIDTHYIFKNMDKVKCRYESEDDIMTTSCCLGCLKPLAGDYISDSITIFAHPFKNLVFEMIITDNVGIEPTLKYVPEDMKLPEADTMLGLPVSADAHYMFRLRINTTIKKIESNLIN